MSKAANVIGYIGLTLSTGALGAALLLFVGGSALVNDAQAKPVGDKSIVSPHLHGPDYYAPPPVIPVS